MRSATSLICTPAIKIKMLLNLPSIILVGLYWSSLMWRHWPCYCHFQNRLTGNLHGPCGRPGARGCIFTKCNRVRKSSSFQVNLNLKPNPNPYCNLMLTPEPKVWKKVIQYHELKRATTTAKTKVAKVRVELKTFATSNLKHSPRPECPWQLIDKVNVLWQSHLQKLLVFRIRLHFVNMPRGHLRWVRIRTGSDCNFFENWRIRTGSDWKNLLYWCDYSNHIKHVSCNVIFQIG